MSDMSGTPLDHQRESELVAALVAGGLESGERRRAERHLAACAGCQELQARLAPAFASIGTTLAPMEPPERLRARVLRRGARPAPTPRARGAAPARLRVAFAALLLAAVPLATLVAANVVGSRAPSPNAATLTIMGGVVELARGSSWSRATDSTELQAGDRVRTDSAGVAVLTFFDGSTLTLEPSTEVALEEVAPKDERGASVVTVFQALGRTWSSVQRLVDPNSRYEIRTPASTAVVRGTAFEVVVAPDGTTTEVTHEGAVSVRGADVSVVATAGSTTTVRPDRAPDAPVAFAPRASLTFAASAAVLVVDPAGLACGVSPNGAIVRQALRCLATEHQVAFAEPRVGSYRVVLRAAGDVALHASAVAGTQSLFERSAAASSRGGELLLTTLAVSAGPDGSLVADRFTPFAPVERAPAKIVERPTPPPSAEPRPTTATTASPTVTPSASPTAVRDTSGPLVAVGAPLSVSGTTPQTLELVARLDDRGGSGVKDEPRARAFVLGRSYAPVRTEWDRPNGLFRATFVIDYLDADVVVFTVAAIDESGNVGTGSATTTVLRSSSTPAPSATVTSSPTPRDLIAPVLALEAPASVNGLLPQEVTIRVGVRDDGGSGIPTAPKAYAEVLGVPLSLVSSKWEPAVGKYEARFLLDRVGPSIAFRVVVIDGAGNVGSAEATTLVTNATPAPTPTPTPVDDIPPTLTLVAPDSILLAALSLEVNGYAKDDGGSGLKELRATARAYDGTGTVLVEWKGNVSWDSATGAYRAVFQIALPLNAVKVGTVVVGIDRAGNAGYADDYSSILP